MLESQFQSKLIKELKSRYKGSEVMKNEHNQGRPDLIILYNQKWAALECKRDAEARHQPNQDYYVKKYGDMSFARFIFPENREDVLQELDKYLLGGEDNDI